MNLRTAAGWNQLLIRFILSFIIWEILGFFLRILLFSHYVLDEQYRDLFHPFAKINWLKLIISDLFQVFFIGVMAGAIRKNLPIGLLGGLIFGISISISAYFAPIFFITQFIKIIPPDLLWNWSAYSSILTVFISFVYTFEGNE